MMQPSQMYAMALLSGFYVIIVTIMLVTVLTNTERKTPLQIQNQNGRMNYHPGGPSRNETGRRSHGDGGCKLSFNWYNTDDAENLQSLRVTPRVDPCCVSDPGSVFLLILVTSSPRQFKVRQAVRDTWASVDAAVVTATGDRRRVLTRFVLGRADAQQWNTQLRIEAEAEVYGDIVQGEFEDVYRNLTLKTITGFKWAASHCPAAAYVMKTDSDVYVNVHRIVQYLSNSSLPHTLVVGDVPVNGTPGRNLVDKWYVSEKTYPHSTYPPYPKGPGYVLSRDVVALLARNFHRTPVFVWEDVYIGMCLQKLGVVLVTEKRFEIGIQLRTGCDIDGMFIVHGVKYFRLAAFWKLHQKAVSSDNCPKNV